MIVSLRPVAVNDALPLMRWSNDDVTCRYMATGRVPLTCGAEAMALWAPLGSNPFIILACEEWWKSEAVGVIGLYAIDRLSRKAELRIMIGPDGRGAGIGTQAVRMLVKYGFEVEGLNRIYLGTAVANLAAVKCFEAAGFRPEGVLMEDLIRDGNTFDNLRMAILRKEWDELRGEEKRNLGGLASPGDLMN